MNTPGQVPGAARRLRLLLKLGLALACAGGALAVSSPMGAHVSPGFVQEVVASGFRAPTSFAFLPDRRILVAEQRGLVWVVDRGRSRPTPFLDIRRRVNSANERGLLAIAVDPDFTRRRFLYAYYTYENDRRRPDDPKSMRLSQFPVQGALARPSGERVILGRKSRGDCNDLRRGADCIPANCRCHVGGGLAVSGDGHLFLGTGDSANAGYSNANGLRAQNLDSLAGKILRVTRAGTGPPGNPFYAAGGRSNRSKVWAYGFREPLRLALNPRTSIPYVGDVGWASWEEIDAALPGRNYGWPCYEGPEEQLRYARFATCRRLHAHHPRLHRPIFSYPRPRGGASITGGAFYRGAYYFGDYVRGWIRYLRFGRAFSFLTGADGPVQILQGADGSLYYLALEAGELRRVRVIGG